MSSPGHLVSKANLAATGGSTSRPMPDWLADVATNTTTANGAAQKAANLSDLASANTALANLAGSSKRNRISNPAMMVSQENGAALLAAANAKYPVDGFFMSYGGTMVFSAQQVAVRTPGGSPNRARFVVTTAQATLAAGDYAAIYTKIEGQNVADLAFGLATAKTVSLRLGVNFPAGTYNVAVQNSTIDRSWVGLFTISAGQAGTDQIVTFVIPGDVTGTWLRDNSIGVQILITLASGTNFVGVAGWQALNKIATSAINNVSALNTFDLFDVGFYEGSVIPPFEAPNYADALFDCQRQFSFYGGSSASETPGVGWCASNTVGLIGITLPRQMRVAPSLAYSALSDWGVANTGGGPIPATFIALDTTTPRTPTVRADVASGLVAGQGTRLMANTSFNARLFFNARL